MGASTDRGSAHNAPRICGEFLRVLGALTSPPASDGTQLICVLELSAGERCAPLARPCAGRLGQDAPAAVRDPSIEKYSRSCRAWAGTATENPAPLNAARRRMIRIDGLSLGNGTAFSAVAPSQLNRERYSDHVPPGPNTWTLNILPLGQFPPPRTAAFC